MTASPSVSNPVRPPLVPHGRKPFDVNRAREDFPILREHVNGRPLVYLDNAATAQKPQVVIDTISRFYAAQNANIHRGVHRLSEQATAAYDQARETTARFLNAKATHEVVFTRGTTDSINLVAHSYGRAFLRPGDEILITTMEHHSNIVPWQLAAQQTGATLRAVPITDSGELDLDSFDALMTERTRIISLVHLSNALGTINPIKRIVAAAHQRGIPVLVDGAQSAPHLGVDVQDLDCDFFAFSGHKLYGPTGVGVLYGKEEFLDRMPPYQGGGDMISVVTLAKSTWAPLPSKFEAGTPMIAEVIGLGAAIKYVESLGCETIAEWEQQLLSFATERVSQISGLRIIGTAKEKAGVLGFVLDGLHPHDIGTILDDEGIAIRAGHHCAQPVMQHFGISGTARASFGLYNTPEEIEALAVALGRVRRMLA